MIIDTLKEAFQATEPITREFSGMMRSSFAYYTELHAHFRDTLPDRLQPSELTGLLTGELRPKFFNHAFCERIQDTLKALRRTVIRLDDFRRAHPGFPNQVNDLETLARLAEEAETLHQRHWEHYRYQTEFTDRDLVAFLAEVDRVGYEWDVYLEGFSATERLLEGLSGKPLPEHSSALRIAYQHAGNRHLAVESLNRLTDFLHACYAFVCSVHDLDANDMPLSLLQVEVGEPVEMRLALPASALEAFRRFLQYLFLKDMLQRDPLLKFVMEAIQKQYREGEPLPSSVVQAHQKEIGAKLKALPEDGRFHISDRAFPDDGVAVMHEFFVSLETQAIPHEALLSGGDKPRRSARLRKPAPVKPTATQEAETQSGGARSESPGQTAEVQHSAETAGSGSKPAAQAPEGQKPVATRGNPPEHLALLTGQELQRPRNP